jgi:glyoxylase-like metal-dependent hydrolase (beta-lactamase superfamily II)
VVGHVTEVAKGVHRLTNGVANFYLIEEAGQLVLVDAGAPKDWSLFTRAALGLGKVAGDLDVLLPGHGEPWTEGIDEAIRQARAAGPS